MAFKYIQKKDWNLYLLFLLCIITPVLAPLYFLCYKSATHVV
ncbi:hypothetical protein ETAE_0055 [Edwardsiella piscicida]|uniref:Uncharacterized protein n=1 Tax=Edwardsiella piscicida TaxID=1263550 RepID=A0AAU8P0J6_EDWPI|nr:hypothetical protein ETAE_0055 [Edwardsiella tarda EIB202]